MCTTEFLEKVKRISEASKEGMRYRNLKAEKIYPTYPVRKPFARSGGREIFFLSEKKQLVALENI